MDDIQEIVGRMDPVEALEQMAAIVSNLFPQVSEQDRLNFVVGLNGGADGDDKVSSLVQL